MPIYEYRCPDCGDVYHLEREMRNSSDVFPCDNEIHETQDQVVYVNRVFSFSYKKAMPEHFNTSLGMPIGNERQLKDEFKRASELASIRTGLEHNFAPVDLRDTAKLGVTSEGLDSTFSQRVKHQLDNDEQIDKRAIDEIERYVDRDKLPKKKRAPKSRNKYLTPISDRPKSNVPIQRTGGFTDADTKKLPPTK